VVSNISVGSHEATECPGLFVLLITGLSYRFLQTDVNLLFGFCQQFTNFWMVQIDHLKAYYGNRNLYLGITIYNTDVCL
jgi:hypothetical protein